MRAKKALRKIRREKGQIGASKDTFHRKQPYLSVGPIGRARSVSASPLTSG